MPYVMNVTRDEFAAIHRAMTDPAICRIDHFDQEAWRRRLRSIVGPLDDDDERLLASAEAAGEQIHLLVRVGPARLPAPALGLRRLTMVIDVEYENRFARLDPMDAALAYGVAGRFACEECRTMLFAAIDRWTEWSRRPPAGAPLSMWPQIAAMRLRGIVIMAMADATLGHLRDGAARAVQG